MCSEVFQNGILYPAELIASCDLSSLPLVRKGKWSSKSTQWSIFQDYLCVFLILHLPGFCLLCVEKERKKKRIVYLILSEHFNDVLY